MTNEAQCRLDGEFSPLSFPRGASQEQTGGGGEGSLLTSESLSPARRRRRRRASDGSAFLLKLLPPVLPFPADTLVGTGGGAAAIGEAEDKEGSVSSEMNAIVEELRRTKNSACGDRNNLSAAAAAGEMMGLNPPGHPHQYVGAAGLRQMALARVAAARMERLRVERGENERIEAAAAATAAAFASPPPAEGTFRQLRTLVGRGRGSAVAALGSPEGSARGEAGSSSGGALSRLAGGIVEGLHLGGAEHRHLQKDCGMQWSAMGPKGARDGGHDRSDMAGQAAEQRRVLRRGSIGGPAAYNLPDFEPPPPPPPPPPSTPPSPPQAEESPLRQWWRHRAKPHEESTQHDLGKTDAGSVKDPAKNVNSNRVTLRSILNQAYNLEEDTYARNSSNGNDGGNRNRSSLQGIRKSQEEDIEVEKEACASAGDGDTLRSVRKLSGSECHTLASPVSSRASDGDPPGSGGNTCNKPGFSSQHQQAGNDQAADEVSLRQHAMRKRENMMFGCQQSVGPSLTSSVATNLAREASTGAAFGAPSALDMEHSSRLETMSNSDSEVFDRFFHAGTGADSIDYNEDEHASNASNLKQDAATPIDGSGKSNRGWHSLSSPTVESKNVFLAPSPVGRQLSDEVLTEFERAVEDSIGINRAHRSCDDAPASVDGPNESKCKEAGKSGKELVQKSPNDTPSSSLDATPIAENRSGGTEKLVANFWVTVDNGDGSDDTSTTQSRTQVSSRGSPFHSQDGALSADGSSQDARTDVARRPSYSWREQKPIAISAGCLEAGPPSTDSFPVRACIPRRMSAVVDDELPFGSEVRVPTITTGAGPSQMVDTATDSSSLECCNDQPRNGESSALVNLIPVDGVLRRSSLYGGSKKRGSLDSLLSIKETAPEKHGLQGAAELLRCKSSDSGGDGKDNRSGTDSMADGDGAGSMRSLLFGRR